MKVARTFIIITSIAVLCCGIPVFAQTCGGSVKSCGQNNSCKTGCTANCQHQQCQQPCQNCQPQQYCPPQPAPMPMFPQWRQAMQPTYQPYFGAQPLMNPRSPHAPHAVFAAANAGYCQAEIGYPKGGTIFPGLQRFLAPDQFLMSTTRPATPIPTYTTRGPRDFFLNDNPSSIGY